MTTLGRKLHGNPWVVLVTACVGYFMTIMNTGSVSIAVPTIQAELGAGLNEILWIVGAYVLALVALVITAGRLGDILGPRTVFLTGMAVFTVAAALCGLAVEPWQLVGARLVQGVGAALIIPQTLTIMVLVFPPERRGVASSVWGFSSALAGILGPVIGGLLVTEAGWRWIFYVNLPTGVLTIALTLWLVPDRREPRSRRLGTVGVALAGAALGALTFGLLEGKRYGWGAIGPFLSIPAILGIGVVLLALFAVQQHRARDPLVPPALFTNRGFAVMSLVMAVISMALMSISLSMTLYLQSVLRLTAAQAGLTLAAWATGMLLGFTLVGRMVDRHGGEIVLVVGLVCYAGSLALLGLLAQPDTNRYVLMAPLLLAGLSQSAAFGPIVAVAMRDVGHDLVGAASGVFNAIRQLGTLAAVGVIGALLQARLDSSVRAAAAADVGQLPESYRGSFVDLVAGAAMLGHGDKIVIPPSTPADVARQLLDHASSAYSHAFSDATRFVLLVCAASVLVAAVGTWLLRRSTQRTRDHISAEEDHAHGA